MKNIYLLLSFLGFIICTAHSQQLIPVPNDSAEITAIVTDEFEPNDIHIELINNTGSSITVTWGLINYAAPVGWEVKLCDNNNCYDLLLNDGPYSALPVAAGDTLDMKFQFSAHLITGTGSANVYAYVSGDSANSVVFLNYKANLTGVSGIDDNAAGRQLSLYPNPVSKTFTIRGMEPAARLTYKVFDLKGAQMNAELNTADSAVEVSSQNLPSGEYILKAFDEAGNITGTARFTKAD
jgi:hypothetical protein